MHETSMKVFMDDFLMFGNSFDSCLTNHEQMLVRCKQAHLVLNWEKCNFMVTEGIMLGLKVFSAGLEVNKAKIGVIAKLPPLTNVKAIRSFLGHTGFYRRFIKDFSKISHLMTKLLKKDAVFDFNEESVLGQREGKHLCPIHFATKTLNNAQQNYIVTEKELLVVVFAYDKFQSYLVLSKTIVFTDHSALKYLFAKQDAKPCLIHSILLLQEFDIEIKNKKGAENAAADHLSRLENLHLEELRDDDIDDNFLDETLTNVSSTEEDKIPWFADFANYLVGKILRKGLPYAQRCKLFSKLKHYFWDEPYLFKMCTDDMIRRCVYGAETRKILDECYHGLTRGHYGPSTTVKKVFDADEMPKNSIQVNEIFDIWGIDFMGRFPKSYKFKYIIVAIDYVSKWAEAEAFPTNDSRVVIDFLKKLFSRFGIPKALISDKGTHFCNKQMEKVLKRHRVHHRFLTAYHPQTSGQVENTNKALKRILEKTVKDNPSVWSRKLDDALWAFRTAYKTPIGTTPYRLLYGKTCHLAFKIEHRAYWVLRSCNPDLKLAGEK
ncbi:putative nucleotidyltransferase, ribonuclease H [Tanacetum coccineum]